MSGRNDTNRTNQCNPNHEPTGRGHVAMFQGKGDRADLNNHGNQLNPNNAEFAGGRGALNNHGNQLNPNPRI